MGQRMKIKSWGSDLARDQDSLKARKLESFINILKLGDVW